LLGVAERIAGQIAGEKLRAADPFVPLIRAGVANVRGDSQSAAEFLKTAADSFDAVDMSLYATVARRHLGQLVGGDEGQALVTEADEWMTGQLIKKPELMSRTLAAGFSSEQKP
jgi:hypothetical protein